jgi:hypothetical protein
LCGVAEPWDRVPDVFEEMRTEVARSGPNDPGVRAKLKEFMDEMGKPKN